MFRVLISGVVQGVGFRPFVYRLATSMRLRGWVRNLGDCGVEVVLKCSEHELQLFLKRLREEKPKPAKVEKVEVEELDTELGCEDFRILGSGGLGLGGVIPPDVGICEECAAEVFDQRNRRYFYEFTGCVACGPRFTTILRPPYDRENTHFSHFEPCKSCEEEYNSPVDRRFHAQTIACSSCGPRCFLRDSKASTLSKGREALRVAAELLREGKILLVKGIGGMHLSCLAASDCAVRELRVRRRRPQQPFAVMAPSIESVRSFAELGAAEERLLLGKERPILVLRKSNDYWLSEQVAPGLDSVGVMLPYSALHLILLSLVNEPLVMTSANPPGEPMVISNSEASQLRGVWDYALLHNLRIGNRCDDSVIKFVNGMPTFLRRSRGFVPEPIGWEALVGESPLVLAVGAELNATCCVLKEGKAYLSQHVGNTRNIKTLSFLKQAIRHMLRILRVGRPEVVVCDLHPAFASATLTEELATTWGAKLLRVQHHFAHLASLMLDSNLEAESKVVGICCDGVGYGADGKVWGGEIILYSESGFERLGSLQEQRMPGGDLAAYWPSRMAMGILYDIYGEEAEKLDLRLSFRHGEKEKRAVMEQLRKGLNVQLTTSAGRFLDAVAALLGVCHYRSYEGEPPMKLEALANRGRRVYDLPVVIKDRTLLTSPIFEELVGLLQQGKGRADLALSAEVALARGLAELAAEVAKREGAELIGFSGGVAYNDTIVREVSRLLKDSGYELLQHQRVPPGDGGISAGQAACCALQLLSVRAAS